MDSEVYTAGEADAGTRLDVWLAAKLGVSRARAQKRLDGATLNGAGVKPSHVLKAGDDIKLAEAAGLAQGSNRATPRLEPCASPALPPILYEDEHLIVLNKPRALSVHVGAGEPEATLVDVLRASGRELSSVGAPDRPGIVHRLDKDTTGVMVVAKTDAAHWKLAEDFASRRVEKTYLALVCGVPSERGRIEAPIGRHPAHRKKMAVLPSGKAAVTEWRVTKSWPKFALLEVNLLTGRTHQIRVHLTHLNHPVAGDELYAGHKRALQATSGEARQAMESLGGQALHAWKLGFAHPVTGEAMTFEAPLAPDFERVLKALD